ncbi:M23 family metallopeptidase [Tessaracoccus sp. G1721]
MIAAAISAALVGGAVSYGQDPLTAVEAVPVPPVMLVAPGPIAAPTSTSSPTGPMGYRLEGWSFDEAPGEFDPFSAPTPQIVPLDGPRPAEAPPPPPPKSIPEESSLGSVGKAGSDDLLSMPVNGRRTSVFGMRYHPILRVWKLHTGLDFAASCGTPVGAAAAGRVVSSGWAGGNGVQVKIDHGMLGGYRVVTTYNHLSAIGVRVGQQVDALDGVGRVGNTGYSTGCHLHFEVIVNGRFTNPEPWLNGQASRVDLRDIAFLDVNGSPTTPSLILGASPSDGSSAVPSESVWDSLIASLVGSPSPSPSGSPSASDSSWLLPSPSDSPSPSPSNPASPSPSDSPTTASPDPSVSDTPSSAPSSTAPESSPPPSTTVPEPTTQAPAPDPTTQAPAPDPTTQAPAPDPTTEAPPPPPPEPEPEPEPPPPPPPEPEPAPTSDSGSATP